MDLRVTSDWTFDSDYKVAFAPTNDPRVLAVIERDEDASFSQCLDGDAILPTYMIDRDRADHVGGYEDDESLANRMVAAQDRFRYAAGYRYNGLSYDMMAKADVMLARWAWIFHGTTINRGSYGYNHAYDILVMNTPAFREHIGVEEEQTREVAQEWVDSMNEEIANIADGYVYGIGWATFPERVTDEEPIDLEDGHWSVEIQCWGFVGEEYAQDEAAGFNAGTPDLPPMLDFAA